MLAKAALPLAALFILSACGGSAKPSTVRSAVEHGPGFSFSVPRDWTVRRTGTSVSILNSNGTAELDGVRRVTNLEDVFVLLTGEEIS